MNAPDYLSADARTVWSEVCGSFLLERHDLARLEIALQAWDRMHEARKVLDAEGPTYVDRFGAPRSRPEIAHERDSRTAFIRAWRELGLDSSDAEEVRPPRLSAV